MKSHRPLRAALFDLDGTLLDTVRDLTDAANLMLTDMGRPHRTEAEIHRFVGRGLPNLVTRCLTENAQASETEIAQGISSFYEHYKIVNGRSTVLYPGVKSALDDLARRHIDMGVVTNKAAAFSEPLIAKMGLSPYFKVIVSGDSLPQKKPDPAPLFYACSVLGVAVQETVMFGDSANDALAAKAAGMPVYLLTYGYSEGQPLDTVACDGLVSRITEAWPLIFE